MDHMPRGVHHHFQIVIRLQLLRGQISDLALLMRPFDSRSFDELRLSFCSVTFASRQAGFEAFTSLCEQVGARLDDMIAGKIMTRMSLTLLNEWAACAELYIRRPRFRHFARALVLQLSHPNWSIVLGSETETHLIDRLTAPSL
jgi:hypothetical protein